MKTVVPFLMAAAQHLRSRAPVPTKVSIQSCSQLPTFITTNAPSAQTMTTIPSRTRMPTQFTTSPLVDKRFAGREDVAVAFRDPRVQSAAHRLAAKIDDLRFVIGYQSAAALGVRAALKENKGEAIAAETVAQRLREFIEQVDEQIVLAKKHITEHEAVASASLERHKPLRTAVGDRLNQLCAERDQLARDAVRRHDLNGSGSRYATLRQAGLSDAQIEATEPAALSPAVLAERRDDRLAEITPIISKLHAFCASIDFNAAHLEGLPEFNGLVAARAEEKAAA